jgi:hypothetical protein
LRRFALLLVFLLTASASGGEEEERPWSGLLGTKGRDFVGARILDADTGRPIPGARLRRFAEDVGGLVLRYARLLGEGKADQDGFAWVSVEGEDRFGHWIADAPGYAAVQKFGLPEARTVLRRGVDVSSRLLDPLGRPVVGAEVEGFLGCPHAPALGIATTGPDGAFVLRDVDPEAELWPIPPPDTGAADSVGMPLGLGTRRKDIVLRAGVTVRGRILDPQGAPIAGAVVRSRYPRGPAAAASADGGFVLSGAEVAERCDVFHPARGDAPVASFRAPPDGGPVELRISPEGTHRVEPGEGTLHVRVRNPGDVDAAEGVRLFLVAKDGRLWEATTRESEGGTEDGTFVAAGTAHFLVPGGRYRLLSASPFDRVGFDPREVEVKPGGWETVEVPPRERARLEIEGELPADGAYGVATRTQERWVREGEEPPWLPPDEPAVLWAHGTAHAIDPAEGRVRTVVVKSPAERPHTIRIAGGRPITEAILQMADHDVLLDADVRDGRVETRASGPMRLTVGVFEEEEGDEVVFRFDLPADRVVAVVLDPKDGRTWREADAAILHLRRPDGTVPEDVSYSAIDGSFSASGGASDPLEVAVPSHVEISAPGLVSLDLDVREPGERTLTWGPCGLRLSVVGPDGRPAEAVVSVDGPLHETKDGALALDGLQMGAHRILVSPLTRNHVGVEWRVDLEDGEVREKTVRFATR